MDKPLTKDRRKSHIDHGDIYFWTATINKWYRLLEKDEYKDVIIQSLQYLTDNGKIDVYAFIIMPNHIHLIWRINEPNGKESSQGSLLKYTAHVFKEMLKAEGGGKLADFKVDAVNKKYEFWQRDSLAIPLFTKKVATQKLNYMHNNPLAERWSLVKHPCDYKYSSARYYEMDEKNFPFLKDIWEVVQKSDAWRHASRHLFHLIFKQASVPFFLKPIKNIKSIGLWGLTSRSPLHCFAPLAKTWRGDGAAVQSQAICSTTSAVECDLFWFESNSFTVFPFFLFSFFI